MTHHPVCARSDASRHFLSGAATPPGQEGQSSPFDGALSNFSGLNCVSDLGPVACDFARLVRPGGRAVFCIFGRTCLWEILWHLLTGNRQKAFRRMRRSGVEARLTPDVRLDVYYHTARDISSALAPWFRLERRSGVGIVVPPSYASSVALRFPRLLTLAEKADRLLGRIPVLKSLADHTVLTFVRTREPR